MVSAAKFVHFDDDERKRERLLLGRDDNGWRENGTQCCIHYEKYGAVDFGSELHFLSLCSCFHQERVAIVVVVVVVWEKKSRDKVEYGNLAENFGKEILDKVYFKNFGLERCIFIQYVTKL